MQHIVDLHGGDGRPLQRRQKNAAQRVTQRETKAALERLGDQNRLTQRVIAGFYFKLCRLDQFSPILVDHASLHSCPVPMSKGSERPRM